MELMTHKLMCNQTLLFKHFPRRDHFVRNWYGQNVSNVLLIYWFMWVVRFLRLKIEFVAKLILISVWWISFQSSEFRLMFIVERFWFCWKTVICGEPNNISRLIASNIWLPMTLGVLFAKKFHENWVLPCWQIFL